MAQHRIYAQQSVLTDPGRWLEYFEGLPTELDALCRVVQGVLIYPFSGWHRHYGIEIEPDRLPELRLRSVENILTKILQANPAPLQNTREPSMRLYGLCRDFSALLVSMLRHQGVPARLRVGFAGFFDRGIYWDHRIVEYWDSSEAAWVLVDPRLDELQLDRLPVKINPLRINEESPFILAGAAWRSCRNGVRDPDSFADNPSERGMGMIRYALLQDFDAMCRIETCGQDAWHSLISKPETEIAPGDLEYLDDVAAATLSDDYERIVRLHVESEYGQAVRERLSHECRQTASK